MKKDTTSIVVFMPKSLKARLKELASDRGETMNGLVRGFIRKEVKAQKRRDRIEDAEVLQRGGII